MKPSGPEAFYFRRFIIDLILKIEINVLRSSISFCVSLAVCVSRKCSVSSVLSNCRNRVVCNTPLLPFQYPGIRSDAPFSLSAVTTCISLVTAQLEASRFYRSSEEPGLVSMIFLLISSL